METGQYSQVDYEEFIRHWLDDLLFHDGLWLLCSGAVPHQCPAMFKGQSDRNIFQGDVILVMPILIAKLECNYFN